MTNLTNFQRLVYKACSEIPRGKVSTYKNLAISIGKPRSFRAVGNALNKNPFAPHIPCHRVVNSNGKVGGFAKGNEKKISLLSSEGIEIEKGYILNLPVLLFDFS